MVASRNSLHQNVATWGAIIAAGLAVSGLIFSAGDAKQTLVNDGVALNNHDRRITALERDVSDIKVTLARIDQATSDTKDTVHRLERGHVVHRAED